jgi:hypothetical protein
VEGAVVLDDFDIVAVAGAARTAHTETIVATVSDGRLDVVFTPIANFSIVSAISVVEQ